MPAYTVTLSRPTTELLYSTVRLQRLDHAGLDAGSGTAFFFRDYEAPSRPVFLVTNKHVLDGAAALTSHFHTGHIPDRTAFCPQGRTQAGLPDPSSWHYHSDPNIDLAVLRVSELKAAAGGALDQLFYLPIESTQVLPPNEEAILPAVMTVVMVGYSSGLWDAPNNLPILRRGTTASHPAVNFEGAPNVLVDIAAFPGSSGSPLVTFEPDYPVRFLGILHSGPTRVEQGRIVFSQIPVAAPTPSVQLTVMIHLGIAVKSRELLAFVRSL